MDSDASERAQFEFTQEREPDTTVVAGFAQFGLAGLTAVDYVADQLDLTKTGHVTTPELPSITPFQEGTPRHHTRLLSSDAIDLTLLMSELFVPVQAARPFGDAILEWTARTAVDEVAVVSGVPVPHGPDQHRTFYVATEDFRERRLGDAAVPPMGAGFLDGVNAALVERGLDSDLAVGVFVTPVHPQAPDAEAALRLLSTLVDVYDFEVDAGPLEQFAADVQQYYADLSSRLADVPENERPEDRMYM